MDKLKKGRSKLTYINDVAIGGGSQRITLQAGSIARVRVSGDTAYIAGSETVLTRYFGVSAATARYIGNRWLSIPSSDRDYATVADDATLTTVLADLRLGGQLTELFPSKLDGERVVGIEGTATMPGELKGTVAGTVYISRSSTPVPVGATFTFGNGETARVALDHWGEHVSLRPPNRVVTDAASREAASSSGGSPANATAKPSADAKSSNASWEGYWVATGRVVAAHDSAVQTPGEIIQRLWLIDRTCAKNNCPLALERQIAGPTPNTLGSPLTAVLTSASNGFDATFTEANVACLGATADYPGTENSNWSFTQASDRTITALETTRTAGPDCETGTTKIIWTAQPYTGTRVAPD